VFINDKLSHNILTYCKAILYTYYTYFTVENKIRIIRTVALWHISAGLSGDCWFRALWDFLGFPIYGHSACVI